MKSRILSLWLPHLATDRIRLSRRNLTLDRPLATFVNEQSGLRLKAVCPLAQQAGLAPGMMLSDARAMVLELAAYPAEPEADAKLEAKLATWCERYTPWVAIDRSHEPAFGSGLWLDITGCAHLFGGEDQLRIDLLARLERQGLAVRAAIADTPGAAWALARHGQTDEQIVRPGNARVSLAPLPVAALRLAADQVAMLERLGLTEIASLYSLPRQTLTARFGEQLVTRLDQALGLIDEPVSPHAPLPAHRAQMIFAEPIGTAAALPPLTDRLLQQLCVGLEAAGLGARRLTLAFYRVDNSTASTSIGTSRPCRDVRQLARLFGEKFDRIDLGFGIERAILDAQVVEPLLPEPIGWRELGAGDLEQARDLAPLVDRLCNRLGSRAVTQLVAQASHLPERAQQQVAALRRPPSQTATAVARSVCSEAPSRPLRLLRRPEPIEAIAPLPDEPPILFRWRDMLHKVAKVRGPERIAPEWWREPDADQEMLTRDYFAVEDTQGGRYWLFREGLYLASAANLPRWYLHGLFA